MRDRSIKDLKKRIRNLSNSKSKSSSVNKKLVNLGTYDEEEDVTYLDLNTYLEVPFDKINDFLKDPHSVIKTDERQLYYIFIQGEWETTQTMFVAGEFLIKGLREKNNGEIGLTSNDKIIWRGKIGTVPTNSIYYIEPFYDIKKDFFIDKKTKIEFDSIIVLGKIK